ncbi:putative two-component membrane permease complex subunit [subsurface metagenome]
MEDLYFRFLNHYGGSHTKQIIDEAVILLSNLWPYLVIGIIATTAIKIYVTKNRIAGFLYQRNNISILIASLAGIVSPLGSYIVIPLSAALFTMGVPLPVLIALLVSSPLIDPILFVLTTGAFGLEVALARLISAFLLGLAAGYTTDFLIRQNIIKPDTILHRDSSFEVASVDGISQKPDLKLFMHELYRMTRFISKYFFLAIILAAAIKIFTPSNLMIKLFQGNDFLSVLLSTGAGIPFYVCGGAAIPVVEQLADLGMSKGAVLAFFISGPVTKVSNLLLMSTVFRFRVFLTYLFTGIIGAIILGLFYNFFLQV